MKTIELEKEDALLSNFTNKANKEPVIITIKGKPKAVIVGIDNADLETTSLSTNPKFIALIERSRKKHGKRKGISSEEIRKRLKI